jgi:hypothetical protein
LRYFHALGKWLVYDNTRWNPDASEEATRRMVDTVKQIRAEASALPGD